MKPLHVAQSAFLTVLFTACASTHEHAAPSGADLKSAEEAAAEMAAQMPAPGDEHAWLQQLVGEWNVSSTMSMGPGTEEMKSQGTETITALGGFWIVCENAFDMEGMGAMDARMTLGYDPAKGKFLGTWVDSMTSHMWVYSGSLDASKKVLTLDAVGPDFMDPTKMNNYRDAITVHDKNHKTITSSFQGPDGSWTNFVTIDCRRK